MDGPEILKMFVQDNGWAGCVVVIARNKWEAIDMMKKAPYHGYDETNNRIEEYPLTLGTVFVCMGDR